MDAPVAILHAASDVSGCEVVGGAKDCDIAAVFHKFIGPPDVFDGG